MGGAALRREVPAVWRRLRFRRAFRRGGLALFGLVPEGDRGADGLLDLLHPFGRELPLEFGQAFFGLGEFFLEELEIVVRGFDVPVLLGAVGDIAALFHLLARPGQHGLSARGRCLDRTRLR